MKPEDIWAFLQTFLFKFWEVFFYWELALNSKLLPLYGNNTSLVCVRLNVFCALQICYKVTVNINIFSVFVILYSVKPFLTSPEVVNFQASEKEWRVRSTMLLAISAFHPSVIVPGVFITCAVWQVSLNNALQQFCRRVNTECFWHVDTQWYCFRWVQQRHRLHWLVL